MGAGAGEGVRVWAGGEMLEAAVVEAAEVEAAEVAEQNAALGLELEATRRRAAALHAQSEGEVRELATHTLCSP